MTTFPAPAPNVVAEELDDDVCLYRPETDDVVVLNQTAGDIWRLADGATSQSGIAATLARAYSADEDEVLGEVQRVIDDLLGRGFLIEHAVG